MKTAPMPVRRLRSSCPCQLNPALARFAVASLLTFAACKALAEVMPEPRPPVPESRDAPPPPPAPADPRLQRHLLAVQRGVTQAVDALRPATTANKNAAAEKALAALDQAQSDLTDCLELAKLYPEIGAQPVTPSPEITETLARIKAFNAQSETASPKLREAINSLQTALGELQQTPAGEKGGARDRLIGDLERAVTDLIAGIDSIINPPASPNPSPPPSRPSSGANSPPAAALWPF